MVGGFDYFFAEEYPGVVRSLALALGDADIAEDIAQEGFARALERWDRVRLMDRPATWVYVVAMNRARDRYRHIARAPDPDASGAVADPAGTVAVSVTIRTALAGLSPRQRQVVVLRFVADLGLDEIGTVMGCALGTVKSTLHQALARLRVVVVENEKEDP